MKKLLLYLFRTAPRELWLVVILGLLGGVASAGLIAFVNRALQEASPPLVVLAGFAGAVLLKVVCGLVGSILMLQITNRCLFTMYDQTCRRIAATPFRRLEEIGTPRILTCLTDDITALGFALQEIPYAAVHAAVLVGCGVYLAFVSWTAAVAMLIVIAIGSYFYKRLMARARKTFELVRNGRDTLFRQFRALTEGIKELQLSRQRREAFLQEDIGGAIEYLRGTNIMAVKHHVVAQAWSQSSFYLLLGIMLFALPAAGSISRESLTAYVFTALFTAAPMWALIAMLPAFNRGQTALDRLESLGLVLNEPEQKSDASLQIARTAPRLQFEGVRFAYPEDGNGSGFALGPLDLEFAPGELVFVVGGNGSGKSTFVKLLTGLYAPQSGAIRVDGQMVTSSDQERYRELFSVVYSDFHLFDRLIGMSPEEAQSKAQAYLAALQLTHKVRIEDGRFSTIALSQGQRRRLALLVAYLQDRPVYVLDEWAADQDPSYRAIFYTRLLPELKRRGKTVVVVTHDDRYYHLGDRIVCLDYGKMGEWHPGGAAAAHSMPGAAAPR